ncbi:MAG TPA: DUF4189 domain-containing protein, partial [Variovorax sp.]
TFRSNAIRVFGTLALICCAGWPGANAATADADAVGNRGPAPRWGAIASRYSWYGYSFSQSTRAGAERAARAQCDQATGRAGTCDVRAYFDRACGALATGNFGEWGAASASTAGAAVQAAMRECNNHLPTEPCKLVVSVCSPGGAQSNASGG